MSQRQKAVITAARRTPVAPRGGFLSGFQADELAAPVLGQLLEDAALGPGEVDHVILGNALYGGGNPARLAALRAGLPVTVPALTLDTQCCSGLDAILLGARMIEAGAAECILAGGAESFSRSPVRAYRPADRDGAAEPYDRPSFAPPPFEDPDMADAAADLAARLGVSREEQAAFAVASHEKALAAAPFLRGRLVGVAKGMPVRDGFTRRLTARTALRAPVLTGPAATGLSAATIACEADCAAAVLLMSEDRARRAGLTGLTILDGMSAGSDPAETALAPNPVADALLARAGTAARDLGVLELMEAYAVQAMATMTHLSPEPGCLAPDSVNPMGGALARGHPIGASGAVLAVNLFEYLMLRETGEKSAQKQGMALIAAAGGLGSGLLVETPFRKGG